MQKGFKKGESGYLKLNDREWLYQKYWVDRLSSTKIAGVVGSSHRAVLLALRRLNIHIRTISEANKGQIPWNAGVCHTEETRAKMRDNHADYKGEKHPRFGKYHTEATKQIMSEKATKRCESKEERERLSQIRRNVIFPIKDTKPERIFIDFYKKFNIADRVKDTRNNSFHIGRLNPDFIIPDMQIAIFINGDYWHSPLLRYNIRDTQQVDFQIRECKKHKWKAVILWEKDLKREDAEQFVLSVLKKEKIII